MDFNHESLTPGRHAQRGELRMAALRMLVVAFAVASIVGACQSGTGPKLTMPDVRGSYELDQVDGHALPYLTEQRHGGATWSLAGGTFTLGADSSYRWGGRWEYYSPSNDSTALGPDSTLSAGRYSVSGRSVVLHDSVSGASLRATLDTHDTLRVSFAGHHYAFGKLSAISPEGAVFDFGGCNDSLADHGLVCPILTDETGSNVREVSGSLYVGSDSMVWAVPTSPVQYVGASRYGWVHVRERYDPNGDSSVVTAVELGSYTWDGTTFTTHPDDSLAFSPATATMRGGLLFVHLPHESLTLFELILGLPD